MSANPLTLMRRCYRRAWRYQGTDRARYWYWIRRGNRYYFEVMAGKLF